LDDAIKDMGFHIMTGGGDYSKESAFVNADAMLPINNAINGISSISKDKTIAIKAPGHI